MNKPNAPELVRFCSEPPPVREEAVAPGTMDPTRYPIAETDAPENRIDNAEMAACSAKVYILVGPVVR
jgi:hypothetical protein